MPNFTDTYIKSLKARLSRYEEYEGEGFGIRVSTTGAKTWIYRYKINGKTEKLTIGYYDPKSDDNMSLANARAKFGKMRQIRRQGLSPRQELERIAKEVKEREEAERLANEGRLTVKKLMLKWYEGYVLNNRKRPEKIKQQIDHDIIPLLGEKFVDEITTKDISTALDVIVDRGASIQANRVLSSIKQAFKYGASRGELPVNPAAGIRSKDIGGLEESRDRVLSLSEIKTLWSYLENDGRCMSPFTRHALKILLLTGVRTSELRLATWDHFDFDKALWSIPKGNTKTSKPQKIHLSKQVISILNILKSISTGSKYVIPSMKLDEPCSDNAFARAARRAREHIGLPHWTVHDLRRTFGTHLDETLHINPVVIEKCLGHAMPKIMATYNKSEMLEERKEALDRWGEFVEGLVSDVKIVSIKRVA